MSEPPSPPEELSGQHVLSAMVARLAGDQAAVASRLTNVEDRVEGIAQALDDIEAVLTEAAPGLPAAAAIAPAATAPPPSTENTPENAAEDQAEEDIGLDMRRLVAWVRDNVAFLLERKRPQTGGYPYWCRKWWMHPEAIARFEAVRRCWAEAVTSGDGNAMVVYFEHLDHHIATLCAENGPFSGCTKGEHNTKSAAGPLGQIDPDEDYFAEFEQAHEPL